MSTEAKPCILVVDDDEDVAAIIRHMLNRAGFDAYAVFSGKSALEWIARRTPDAIILDLMMPEMNGFAVLRQLRLRETNNPLPVIVLTARGDHQSRAESAAAGVHSFLTKPVRSQALVEHVRLALERRTTSR